MAKKKDNLKVIKTEDLEKRVVTLREDIRLIRFKAEHAKPKNVKETARLKKDIARILTEIRSRAAVK